MTDLAHALADTSQLTPFDGHDVIRTTVAVTNAGDGLSEAMKIDPTELHHGDRVYLVLECEVAKVRFDPVGDTDALSRVHILRAGTAAMVDKELVESVLAEQRIKIDRARDAAKGQSRLPTDEELLEAHTNGEHADGLVPGCVECDREQQAVEEEAAADLAAAEADPPASLAGRRARKAKAGD